VQAVGLIFLLISIMSNAIVYGTDAFCAIVLRSAMARVDDATLARAMGYTHLYGDRRMPVVGAFSFIVVVLSIVSTAVAGSWASAILAGTALLAAFGWLAVYTKISAPINRVLVAAVQEDRQPDGARELQKGWDRVINLRVALQAYILAALAVAVAVI
jgi:glucan phosphoethanolaminetransferase (alkaline phosphatase superfamily)